VDIDAWPRPLRWLLFLPAAALASIATHFLLSLPVSGGDWISGPLVNQLEAVWREVLMRFLEPWSFVAAAAFVSPARKAVSISTAALFSTILIGLLLLQLSSASAGSAPLLQLLRGVSGIAGAIAGAVTGVRLKTKHEPTREDVPPEFIELLLQLDPKSND
jgi:hypothetical protein